MYFHFPICFHVVSKDIFTFCTRKQTCDVLAFTLCMFSRIGGNKL